MSRCKATPDTTRMGRGKSLLTLVLALALTLTGLVFLAGCTVDVGLDTRVEADGSGTVSVRLAADQELQDTLSGAADGLGGLGSLLDILGGLDGLTGDIPGSVDELFDTILGEIPGEWEVERGTDDDGTRWLAMTRPFADPAELEALLSSSTLASVVDLETLTLTQEEGLLSTKTRFSTTADVGGAMSQLGDALQGLPLDLVGQVLVIENRVTLPGTVGENNADEVQGNTLVWNVGTSDAREMYAESVTYNWAAIAGLIVAGAIIIAVLVVVLVLLLLRRRPSSPPQEPQSGENPYAPAPTDPAASAAIALPPVGSEGQPPTLPPGTAAPELAPSPATGRPELAASPTADRPELAQPATVRALGAGPLPAEKMEQMAEAGSDAAGGDARRPPASG